MSLENAVYIGNPVISITGKLTSADQIFDKSFEKDQGSINIGLNKSLQDLKDSGIKEIKN